MCERAKHKFSATKPITLDHSISHLQLPSLEPYLHLWTGASIQRRFNIQRDRPDNSEGQILRYHDLSRLIDSVRLSSKTLPEFGKPIHEGGIFMYVVTTRPMAYSEAGITTRKSRIITSKTIARILGTSADFRSASQSAFRQRPGRLNSTSQPKVISAKAPYRSRGSHRYQPRCRP